jgi:AcrR family transcriptional regulator
MKVTARGKGRPRLAETADIDRAVGEAALRLLLEQGEGATMNAIAAAAGLSRKSLYARFPNKTELFLTVIRDLMTGLRGLEFDRSGDAKQQLRHYIETALEVVSRPQSQALQRLLTMDSAYVGALRADMIAASHTLFYQPLRDLLTRATDAGDFVVRNVDATALAVMRLIFAEGMALGSEGLDTDAAAYASFLTDLVIKGLEPRD